MAYTYKTNLFHASILTHNQCHICLIFGNLLHLFSILEQILKTSLLNSKQKMSKSEPCQELEKKQNSEQDSMQNTK